METPTIKILKGRKSLNDWFCLKFRVCNQIDFELSFLGYGISFNLVIHNPSKNILKELE